MDESPPKPSEDGHRSGTPGRSERNALLKRPTGQQIIRAAKFSEGERVGETANEWHDVLLFISETKAIVRL